MHLNNLSTRIEDNCIQPVFWTWCCFGNTGAFLTSNVYHKHFSVAETCAPRLACFKEYSCHTLCIQEFTVKLRGWLFCFSVRYPPSTNLSQWGTHLAKTFLRWKLCFRIVCLLPTDLPVQLAISFTDNHMSSLTAFCTTAMFALVTDFRPSKMDIIFNRQFPSCKSLNPSKTC